MLFSHFPINVTVWVFKDVVSGNNDFLDVPAACGKDRRTVVFLTEDSFTRPTGALYCFSISRSGNGRFKPGTRGFAKLSLSQHKY